MEGVEVRVRRSVVVSRLAAAEDGDGGHRSTASKRASVR